MKCFAKIIRRLRAFNSRRGIIYAVYAFCFAVPVMLGACSDKHEARQARPPVPVKAALAVCKDVPVQLHAIGSVEPYNTVSIKAQVNGPITKVHFREGQMVRKGDLLFTIDQRPFKASLKSAEALLAKDRAQAKFARNQVRRYSQLLKDGIVPQDQYDQLSANADAYAAAIKADKAAVEDARLQLGYCSIHSPITGRTGNLMVQPGNLVKANDVPVLVTINQITPIYAAFSVTEKELPAIRKNLLQGRMKVETIIPDDPQTAESGTITFLDNSVDTSTGNIKLKGTFSNTDQRLWPGQFVNIILTLTTRTNAVVVPSAAIQTGQQGQFVFVVKPDLTVDAKSVTAGLSIDGETVIDQGINSGETVVTDGQVRLVPGAKVEIKKTGP